MIKRLKSMYSLPFKFRYLWVGALILFLFELSKSYTRYVLNQHEFSFSWYTISTILISNYLCWILLTPFVYYTAEGYLNWSENKQNHQLLKLLRLSLSLILLHVIIFNLTKDFFYFFKTYYWGGWWHPNKKIQLITDLFNDSLQYVMLTAIFIAIAYYHKYLLKQKELNQARLQALINQLQPHFLFNTLNSIASLIDLDSKSAQRMLVQLSNLLRSILDQESLPLIRLEQELQFTKNYLAIEQVRFQDRLKVFYEISPETLDCQVPNLLLQPLIENAIKHGISQKKQEGKIYITTSKIQPKAGSTTKLEITIKDNGNGISQTANGIKTRKKLGLANIQKRLQHHYQQAYLFEAYPLNGQGFQIRIQIPFNLISKTLNVNQPNFEPWQRSQQQSTNNDEFHDH